MSERQLTKYTWEEIRKHNNENDCWVVLYDRVLDVTDFLNEHPGGLDTINDLGGYDITNSFESIGHSPVASALSKKFVVGALDCTSVPPPVQRKELAEDVPLTKVRNGVNTNVFYYILGSGVLLIGLLHFLYTG
uniref:Putative cytochrome b5 n=1 Tax=Trypanosoma vivax (strain Y486) TaxID=1055687 RepID=G0UBL9_TRYVY|nr:putative cytochrome b5 [Trypanosoma vivax Y486]